MDSNNTKAVKRKHKSLSIAEKQKLIEEVKKGSKLKKDIAAQFGIPTSTLSTILKNEDRINETTSAAANKKRKREAEFPDIEKSLVKWFQQCRNNNINLGGPILKEKAEIFAKLLGHNDFKASNGWLENFKKRNGIVFRKVCGESASVSEDVCIKWKRELQELLKDYEPHNVFNADETALFFKCLPDKTMTFKDQKCHGGKHSKERVTLLLATNMTGTEKLKPLMIGKSQKPRCFAGCKSFPIDYSANKKAWMNAELFAEWLVTIEKKMKKEKRNIILFIDNCTAHNVIPSTLQSVKVKFLPPNTTSMLQPLDQGIIKNFKTFYRKEVVRKIILDMEDGKLSSVNMLQAMRMVDKSWRNVEQKTIVNCFKACGFSFQTENEELEVEPASVPMNIEAEWSSVVTHLNAENIAFEDYVNIDNDVAVMGSMTDTEIVESLSQPQGDEDDNVYGEEEELPEPPVSAKQARVAISTLRTYLERSSGVKDNVFSAIVTIENEVEVQMLHAMKQPKITQFFNSN